MIGIYLIYAFLAYSSIPNSKTIGEVLEIKKRKGLTNKNGKGLVSGDLAQDMTRVWDNHKPYKRDEYIAFLKYWLIGNDGLGRVIRSCKVPIPPELVAVKMWFETGGGLDGVAKKDPTALFGFKGKNGIKGYDNVDKEKVQYKSYVNRAASIRDFIKLVGGGVGYSSRIYRERFKAWSELSNKQLKKYTAIDEEGNKHHFPLVNTRGKQPQWYYWLLAMQAHPSKDLKKSEMAYAACGWPTKKIEKRGATEKMRQARLYHSFVMIKFLLRKDVTDVVNSYYIKYGDKWDSKIVSYGGSKSVYFEYNF